MEVARFRRNCRILFFIAAMVSFAGLGLYLLEYEWGLDLLIAGVVVLILTWSITRFFAQFEFQAMLQKSRVDRIVRENEKKEE